MPHATAAAEPLDEPPGVRSGFQGFRVAPNALYSHVADKDALLDGVLDRLLGDVVVPDRGGWRARIEAIMDSSRQVLLAQPDLIPHALARQSVGPNALLLGEAVLEQLGRGGITGARAARAKSRRTQRPVSNGGSRERRARVVMTKGLCTSRLRRETLDM